MTDERHDHKSGSHADDAARRPREEGEPAPEDAPVTAGKRISDAFDVDQPTDETDVDPGAGKDEPTPNPADLAP